MCQHPINAKGTVLDCSLFPKSQHTFCLLFQFTAIMWIKEFVQLSGRTMLPFASGILTAVLPCLAFDSDSKKSILVKNIKVSFWKKGQIILYLLTSFFSSVFIDFIMYIMFLVWLHFFIEY